MFKKPIPNSKNQKGEELLGEPTDAGKRPWQGHEG
jgi:hypothetical protein